MTCRTTHYACGCFRERLDKSEADRDFYKQTLIGLRAICPCGGIILADTEDWEIPLCPDCYEECGGIEEVRGE